jgi:hypothetical protein
VIYPLQYHLLAHGRNGVADLVDNRLQCVGGYAKPPRPGTNLTWISEINLIAKGRTLDALHGGIPGLSVNGM